MPQLDPDLLERIRQEEILRQEVRASLKQPEREKSRFEKLLALLNTNVGIGTVAALLVSAGTWSWTVLDDHLHAAEREATKARAQALVDVQNVSPFLPMLAREDSPDRALACRVLFFLIANRAINETLGQGLANETGTCLSAKQFNTDGKQDKGLIDENALARLDRRSDPKLEVSNSSGMVVAEKPLSAAETALAQALPKRVYIQYANVAQRDAVQVLRKEYEKRGWIVPSAESVGAKAPAKLQVRFFHEADRQAAEGILKFLRGTPPFSDMPQADTASLLKLSAPPGQMEVWLPG